MRKKLIFLIFLGFLMAGCGASDTAAPEIAADEYAPQEEFAYQTTEAPGTGEPGGLVETTAEIESVPETEAPAAVPDAEAMKEMNGTNYFTFNRGSSITTAEDGTELLYEYSCDSTFTSWNGETQQWVEGILEQIRRDYTANSENLLQYAQGYLEDVGADYFYSFSNYQELGAARHDTHVVSLLVLSSVYSGGAHPNAVQTAWNLDLEQHRLLRLEDVIDPEQAGTLAQMVLQQIEETFAPMGEGALFADYAQSIEAAFLGDAMTPYWYFNDSGMVIFFNQYELGPYAAGIIKAELPYDSLKGILLEDYFPKHDQIIPGDMLLRGDWSGYRKIPITVESDGQQLLIGVEGEVYQVQLSEVFWLEGTAIGQQMLFSADRMSQNDILELIGGYDDESRSFALEFSDGQGNLIIYYIHPEGLSEAP